MHANALALCSHSADCLLFWYTPALTGEEVVILLGCYMAMLLLLLAQVMGVPFHIYPAVFHSFPLSVFASLIAPFGGFFASGFKRAFKVKVSCHNPPPACFCSVDTTFMFLLLFLFHFIV